MSTIPPYLKKGDTIGIVCPAGFMPVEKIQTCISVLMEWGYKVKAGATAGSQFNYFSGTDEQRLHDLQQMMDDDSVQAILCARGGYGVGRIIDQLSFKKFKKNPKWIVGFSDITVLHSHIYNRFKIASLHAPMAAAFNNEEYKNEYVQSLKQALEGEKTKYTCAITPYNNIGNATAKLVGGNLSLLSHLIGTRSDVDTDGKLLFIEEVGEYIYNIDRMLYQLKRNGKFNKLAGLIIGGFSETKDTTIPFGKDVYEVIYEMVKDYKYPVCFQFPVGHIKENYALKIGVEYALHVGQKKVQLSEE
ncbi:LD-carboxypeptidase [Segetibacter sp.]|jgi:muramoyltetrapeptide carboxypeptidase|uniref:S66 peptidase family protein n=1 Tax=Segetibacter sp. TaxID=2231182 RepID=UPI00261C0893|nr:LD-carboxypeptidase [Segetibacter sp.]MCW3078997.1 peptidase [Segetibacter sp.]